MINVDLKNIDFNSTNVIFVDGLTLERIKIKYNWLLNANIKDAIIGEDANGIVWYFGEWYDGEWYNGTWYSGTWYNGTWKNGNWYSYNMDKFQVLSQNFQVLSVDNSYSNFINGIWENGIFNSGTFGANNLEDWENYTQEIIGNNLYTDKYYTTFKKPVNIAGNVNYEYKKLATWIDGTFNSGLLYDCIWCSGIVKTATATNIQWINGKWFGGTFDGYSWYNGLWYNGSFINGVWYNGTFTKLDNTKNSRFGDTKLSGSTICTWKNGTWKNGEFFSGLILDSNNNILPSIHNNISIWENGEWFNGIWYGGHFKSGNWYNGTWENGVFGNIGISDWFEPVNVYQIGNQSYDWTDTQNDIETLQTYTISSGDTKLSLVSGYTNPENYSSKNEYTWSPIGITKANISNYNKNNTYWEYTWINNNNLSSNVPNEFVNGEQVFILSDRYTGTGYTTYSANDGTNYKLTIDVINGVSFSQESGRIYSMTAYNSVVSGNISNILLFNGFDFSDVHYKIKSYQIRLKRWIENTNNEDGDFVDSGLWFNIGNTQGINNINLLEYDPSFFIVEYDWLNDIKPYQNKLKINDYDTSGYTLYGKSIDDLWELNHLSEYANNIPDLISGLTTDTNDYEMIYKLLNIDVTSPDNINDIDNYFNICLKYTTDFIETKKLKICDIGIRLIYEQNTGTWKNGTWKNGTWLNGTFENGTFLSGLWLDGNFNNGQIGGN